MNPPSPSKANTFTSGTFANYNANASPAATGEPCPLGPVLNLKNKVLPNTAPQHNIKNALFVGSTAELQKMLNKQSMETKKEKRIENETVDGKSKDSE